MQRGHVNRGKAGGTCQQDEWSTVLRGGEVDKAIVVRQGGDTNEAQVWQLRQSRGGTSTRQVQHGIGEKGEKAIMAR